MPNLLSTFLEELGQGCRIVFVCPDSDAVNASTFEGARFFNF